MLFFALTVTIIVVRKVQFPVIPCIYEIFNSSYVAISYCLFYSLYVFMKQETQHEQKELMST